MSLSDSLRNTILPAVLAVGGAVVVGRSLQVNPHALSMNAGLEGCLAAGMFGFVLALLHGISFPRALFALSPIVVVQAIGYSRTGLDVVALVALELMVCGLLGLIPWPTGARRPDSPERVGGRPLDHAAPGRRSS